MFRKRMVGNRCMFVGSVISVIFMVGCGPQGGGENNTDMKQPVGGEASTHFVASWSAGRTIKIEVGAGEFLYDVDWDNDGVFDDIGLTEGVTHEYEEEGGHTIRIRGKFPHMKQVENDGSPRLREVKQWGNIEWKSMESMFAFCKNMEINAPDTPNLSQVSSMKRMFYKTSRVSVTNGAWDVSKVADMEEMFAESEELTLDVSTWDVSSVESLKQTFQRIEGWVPKIEGWDVSSVTDMRATFADLREFNVDISKWNVSSVTDMNTMFGGSLAFNQDISKWDVSSVTDMRAMFGGAAKFNADISGWDTSNVVHMNRMFKGTTSFDQNLGNWNITGVDQMYEMFAKGGISMANYDAILEGWSKQSVKQGVPFEAGEAKYCMGEAARETLLNMHGWTIADGGKGC